MEVYVVYDKGTGRILAAGRIDKAWDLLHPDPSTATAQITEMLNEDPNRDVLYLPDQRLPDPEQQKIEDGMVVNLSSPEVEDKDQHAVREALVHKEIRRLAVESLIAKGKLPAGYE